MFTARRFVFGEVHARSRAAVSLLHCQLNVQVYVVQNTCSIASKRSASTNKFFVSGVTLDATEIANDKTASQQGSAKRGNMASQTQGDGRQEKRPENIRRLARGVGLRMWRDPRCTRKYLTFQST